MATDQITQLANRTSRSTVAVIDAITQRGGFKGEELSTIGQLRYRCIQLMQLAEAAEADAASPKE